MNIMLVSVTQRTLGDRGKAQACLLFEFLTEALTISFVGGSVGMAVAYGFGFALFVGKLTFYSAMASHAEGWRY
jgi:hypothetical protein